MRFRSTLSARRYIRDIVYLVIMTAIIPVVVASYVYRKEGHDISLYDIGLWTFVVGTVFFHFLCYIRKDSASPQLPRLIDYIYVCSAVIGLSGTAREIDRTVRVNTYSESVRLSKLNLNWMKDQVDKAAKSACAESTSGAQCSDLTSVRIFIEEGLPKALAISPRISFMHWSRSTLLRGMSISILRPSRHFLKPNETILYTTMRRSNNSPR